MRKQASSTSERAISIFVLEGSKRVDNVYGDRLAFGEGGKRGAGVKDEMIRKGGLY